MFDLTDNPSTERIWLYIRFANWACDRLKQDADFSKKKIIFSDEAHFDLGGHINKQNGCVWGTENPHAYIEKPTHPKQVTVWCRSIIGLFFFENEQGEALQLIAIVMGPC